MFDVLDVGIRKILGMIRPEKLSVLIPIAGYTCSGKSFIASLLETIIFKNGYKVSRVCQDDYYKEIDDPSLPRDERGRALFDVPDSFHNTSFIDGIACLMSGQDIWSPEYSKIRNKINAFHGRFVCAAPVIITEGLYTIKLLKGFCPNIIKVYVHADENVCLKSKINRDTLMLGVKKEEVEKMFNERVLPYQRQYVKPQREMADIVIINNERR